MKLFFNLEEVTDVASLLGKFGSDAFASPYRSTVPLVALVKDGGPVFSAIATSCGASLDLSVHFEYRVEVPGVLGNPSQTDAMVISPAATVAFEAKWTEPRYETVATRLKNRVAKLTRDDPDNAARHQSHQEAVIGGWLGLLNQRCQTALRIDDISEAVYQTVHRAASACAMHGPARLAYIHFQPSGRLGAASSAQYVADLEYLHARLGHPGDFPFYLVELPLQPTDGFRSIQALEKGQAITDRRVREAIASTRLFDFGEPRIQRIGA